MATVQRHPHENVSPDLMRMISRVVHPRHGLITGLFEQELNPTARTIRVAHAVVTPPTYFRANQATAIRTVDAGTGAGFDRETACWAALGEAIERYAASLYWPDQVVCVDVAGLPGAALGMDDLIRIGNERVVPFDAGAIRGWMRGCDLSDRSEIFVPAAMCVLGYKSIGPQEIVAQNDSTGLACGRTFEDAALRGLCEVLERDAFASNWLLNRAAPRLTFNAAAKRHLRKPVTEALDDPELRLSLHYLACSFGVHVVLGVAHHPSRGYGVVSAAASPDPVRVVEKAVAEALHGWTAACVLSGRAPVDTLEAIRTPSDHVSYYLDAGRFEHVRRLTQSPERLSFDDMLAAAAEPPDLADITGRIREHGLTAAAVDLTPPDIADLGLAVARVVVPGLQPLVFGAGCVQAPDTRRLEAWRRMWRLADGPLNPLPHPFP